MGDRLTHDAHRALELAEEEARFLGHGSVGVEHLLLALIRMLEEGSAATGVEVLRRVLRGRDIRALRKELAVVVPNGPTEERSSEPRSTPAMERALRHAYWRAEDNGRARVGTEHLLLGVFRDLRWDLRRALERFGVAYPRVVRQLVALGALRGPHDPRDMDRVFDRDRKGPRVILPSQDAHVALQRLPELLPPSASCAFNRLNEGMAYVRISEGLDAAEYVRRALALGPVE